MLENTKLWTGVVEDLEDPLEIGRVRVRIHGIHTENKEQIPINSLPWAAVVLPVTSASTSGKGHAPTGILKGTWVTGFFRDGESMQEPVVLGTLVGIPKEKPIRQKGFNDNNEEYPDKEYLESSDVNKLARTSDLNETIVKKKEENRITDFRLANTDDVRTEPLEPHISEYPYVHTYESESGIVEEFDDTPGNRRWQRYHPEGTYEEIQDNGSRVLKVVGDNYEILARHNTLYVGGTCTLNVAGAVKIRCETSVDLEVHGPVKAVYHDDVHEIYEKNLHQVILGNKTQAVHGNFNLDVLSDYNIDVAKNHRRSVEQNTTILGGGYREDSYIDYYYIFGGKHFAVNSGTVSSTDQDGNKTYDLTPSGSRIDINSDDGSGNPVAENINVVEAEDEVDRDYDRPAYKPEGIEPFHDDLRPQARSERHAHEFDDDDNDFTQEWFDYGITSGFFTETSFNVDPTIEQEFIVVKPNDEDDDDPNYASEFEDEKEFPAKLQLTPNFTLGDVSSRAVVTQQYVRPQHGLTRAQIVANLKLLCERVAEPIHALYPDMFVTSGFRARNYGSQHEFGMAIDIQFRNITTNRDYYERAIEIAKILPGWDQFILEFKNTGTKLPWIHISYKRDDNRGQTFTMFNTKRVSDFGKLALVQDDTVVAEKTLRPRAEV